MSANVAERFWSKVDRRGPDDCWPWLAYRDRRGYGHFHIIRNGQRSNPGAHVVAYWLSTGQWELEGLERDHTCRNTWCVNPSHLEPVTHLENVRCGAAGKVNGARIRGKTHCPAGHPYDEANTRRYRDGRRRCRACHRVNQQRYLLRKAGAQ